MSTTTANPPAAAAATKGTREKGRIFRFFLSLTKIASESNPSLSSAANFYVSLPPPLDLSSRKSGTRTANLNDVVLFARVFRGE